MKVPRRHEKRHLTPSCTAHSFRAVGLPCSPPPTRRISAVSLNSHSTSVSQRRSRCDVVVGCDPVVDTTLTVFLLQRHDVVACHQAVQRVAALPLVLRVRVGSVQRHHRRGRGRGPVARQRQERLPAADGRRLLLVPDRVVGAHLREVYVWLAPLLMCSRCFPAIDRTTQHLNTRSLRVADLLRGPTDGADVLQLGALRAHGAELLAHQE